MFPKISVYQNRLEGLLKYRGLCPTWFLIQQVEAQELAQIFGFLTSSYDADTNDLGTHFENHCDQ